MGDTQRFKTDGRGMKGLYYKGKVGRVAYGRKGSFKKEAERERGRLKS